MQFEFITEDRQLTHNTIMMDKTNKLKIKLPAHVQTLPQL